MFFWQALIAGKKTAVRYVETVISRTTGIGGILAHLAKVSRAFETKGWQVYLSPGCTRYSHEILSKYFKIRNKPEDAAEDNTVLMDNYSIYSIPVRRMRFWEMNETQD